MIPAKTLVDQIAQKGDGSFNYDMLRNFTKLGFIKPFVIHFGKPIGSVGVYPVQIEQIIIEILNNRRKGMNTYDAIKISKLETEKSMLQFLFDLIFIIPQMAHITRLISMKKFGLLAVSITIHDGADENNDFIQTLIDDIKQYEIDINDCCDRLMKKWHENKIIPKDIQKLQDKRKRKEKIIECSCEIYTLISEKGNLFLNLLDSYLPSIIGDREMIIVGKNNEGVDFDGMIRDLKEEINEIDKQIRKDHENIESCMMTINEIVEKHVVSVRKN